MLSLVTPVHRPSIFSSKSVERSRHKNRGGFIDRQHKGVGVILYYPFIIMSTTHHTRVLRVKAFVIAWTR